MASRRIQVTIPESLAVAIDTMVGKRGRSRFLVGCAYREIKRLQQLRALQQAAGAWKSKDHPELRRGSAAWIRKLRRDT